MKIFVIGTRGIPDILGGVETHCESLYPYLVEKGCDITLIRRKPYVKSENKQKTYKGIKLIDLYSPHLKSLEAITHTTLGVFYAFFKSTDILHIHAIGPSILTPLARILGMKVVVTNHGPDYDRGKWGFLAKKMLQAGERFGAKYANQVIVISTVIKELLRKKYNCLKTNLIYNGVSTPSITKSTNYINSLGLTSKKYIITVGRFVEEKGFDYLIDSYLQIRQTEYKLVLIGDADHDSKFSKMLKQKARESNVILTGFIKGEQLNEIFSHAYLFILPSFHEGLPISLLEAMSYNLNVIVSDIPANKEVNLNPESYFQVGNKIALKEKIEEKLLITSQPQYDLSNYNWQQIANQTYDVYKKVLGI